MKKRSEVYDYSREGGRGLSFTLLMVVVGLVFACGVIESLASLYRLYDLRNQLAYVLRSADLEPDLELRKKVLAATKRAGIECVEQDIVLSRSSTSVALALSYRQRVGVPFLGGRWAPLSFPIRLALERDLTGS